MKQVNEVVPPSVPALSRCLVRRFYRKVSTVLRNKEVTIMGNAGTSTLLNFCAEMSLASVTDQSCGTDALLIWCHIKRNKYTMRVYFSINLRRPRGYLLFVFQDNMARAAGIAGAGICGT